MICKERHHTTLHEACVTVGNTSTLSSHVSHRIQTTAVAVPLATARVYAADRSGSLHKVRALIDPGSEVSVITDALAQRLRLPRAKTSVAIFGVGAQRTGMTRGIVNLEVKSRTSDFLLRVCTHVLPRVTLYAGKLTNPHAWPHLEGIELADPDCHANDPVELLLGADQYAAILKPGLCTGGTHAPVAQHRKLGWILSRVVDGGRRSSELVLSHQCSVDDQLTDLVQQFWEQEAWPTPERPLTKEEERCKDLFASIHSRTAEGRYVVRLPFKSDAAGVDDTCTAAVRLLQTMERKFNQQPKFQVAYRDFMREYELLGHISRASATHEADNQRIYYLPHHRVVKESSTTTKLRVVFNGSQRGRNGE
ncbi:bel12-ag transposon polyprotein, partial [Lasius niger]